jgi:hypothetical protein
MVYVDAAASVSKGKQAKRILRVRPAEFEQMCELAASMSSEISHAALQHL